MFPAVDAIVEAGPDVVLVDDLDDSDESIELVAKIKAEQERVAVIVLASTMDPEWLDAIFAALSDTTRRRIFEVHVLADEIRIFEDGALVATHAPLEGRGEKRLDPSHRKSVSSCRRSLRDEPRVLIRAGDRVVRRSLDFYAAVGRRLADLGGAR